MSHSFYLEDKGTQPLVLERILSLCSNPLAQFSFDEETEQSHLQTTLDEIEFIILGDNTSCRGFELAYDQDNKYYIIRVSTPSTIADWKLALEFIKKLAVELNCDIVDEEDNSFTIDTLNSFDYESNILAGLNAIKDRTSDAKEFSSLLFPGLHFDLCFNKQIIEDIFSKPEPIVAFSEFCDSIYQIDAYCPSQMILQDGEKNIFGMYIIQADIPLIIPKEPTLSYSNYNIVQPKDIENWYVSYLNTETGQLSERELYKNFVQRLPADKCKLLDANNMLLPELTHEELATYIG